MRIMGSVRLIAIGFGLVVTGPAVWAQSGPSPTLSPTATPVPTAVPTATPVPTAVPTSTPVPTGVPSATPVPTATPSVTTTPTATPVNIPIVPGAGGPGGSVPWLLVVAMMALALLLVWARRARD